VTSSDERAPSRWRYGEAAYSESHISQVRNSCTDGGSGVSFRPNFVQPLNFSLPFPALPYRSPFLPSLPPHFPFHFLLPLSYSSFSSHPFPIPFPTSLPFFFLPTYSPLLPPSPSPFLILYLPFNSLPLCIATTVAMKSGSGFSLFSLSSSPLTSLPLPYPPLPYPPLASRPLLSPQSPFPSSHSSPSL